MTAGFHAFCHNSVSSAPLHHLSHCYTGNHRHDLYSRFLERLHIFGRVARTCSDHLDSFLDHYLHHIRGIGIHQHDIDTYGLICQGFCLSDLFSYHLCGRGSCSNDTESACFRDSCRKMMFCHPCHTTLNNGIFYLKKLCYPCFHSSTPFSLR